MTLIWNKQSAITIPVHGLLCAAMNERRSFVRHTLQVFYSMGVRMEAVGGQYLTYHTR